MKLAFLELVFMKDRQTLHFSFSLLAFYLEGHVVKPLSFSFPYFGGEFCLAQVSHGNLHNL